MRGSERAWTRRSRLYVVAVTVGGVVVGGGLGGCSGTREVRLPECRGTAVPINAAATTQVDVAPGAMAAAFAPEVTPRAH